MTGAVLLVEKYSIPLNYESFKIHLDDMRKDLCEVNGMASLRSFKNYFLHLNQTKRNLFLDGLVPIFLEFERNSIGSKGELPNLMDEAFHKWKNFPRFTSNPH